MNVVKRQRNANPNAKRWVPDSRLNGVKTAATILSRPLADGDFRSLMRLLIRSKFGPFGSRPMPG